jgi:hypothetical protein
MKSHASVRRNLPLASVAARFLLMAFLVFATFNPSYYSISTWIFSEPSLLSIKLVAGFGLILTWLIVLRIVIGGLGSIGLVYLGLALAVLAVLGAQFGLPRGLSTQALLVMAELGLAIALTFGLVFSYWVRQASGQSAVVKNPP